MSVVEVFTSVCISKSCVDPIYTLYAFNKVTLNNHKEIDAIHVKLHDKIQFTHNQENSVFYGGSHL